MKRNLFTSLILFLLISIFVNQVEAYVAPEASVKKYVDELCGKDESKRGFVHLRLAHPEYYKRLRRYSSQIVECLKDYETSEESSIILGLLDLPDELKNALLKSKNTPAKVKARLGDKEAEQKVIEKFNTATLEYKETYALQLLYIGTPDALTSFIEMLESTEYYHDSRGKTESVALAMIWSYGQVNPDVPLFSSDEYIKHCYTTREEFQRPEHQEYLRRVEKYFLHNFNIEIHIKAPFLIEGREIIEKFYIKNK